jgi:hypothetical protein
MNCIESLEWIGVGALPDSDTTVLCWGAEGFFCGWWDSSESCWRDCESGGVVDGVTHWAEPKGPQS